jgi:hypothetical protein
VAIVLAGCGGGHRPPHPNAACARLTAREAGSRRPPVKSASGTLATCAYGRIELTVDAAPQAALRFRNSRDEADQVAAQGGFAFPRTLHRVGDDAYWLPRSHQLKVLVGTRILTIDAPTLPVARRLAAASLAP